MSQESKNILFAIIFLLVAGAIVVYLPSIFVAVLLIMGALGMK